MPTTPFYNDTVDATHPGQGEVAHRHLIAMVRAANADGVCADVLVTVLQAFITGDHLLRGGTPETLATWVRKGARRVHKDMLAARKVPA